MPAKGSSVWIAILGYLILAAGIVNVGFDIHHRAEWAVPTDMGLVVGELALIMFGVVTLSIAQCLRQMEKRLDQIEAKLG